MMKCLIYFCNLERPETVINKLLNFPFESKEHVETGSVSAVCINENDFDSDEPMTYKNNCSE
jgi:hypothetical protein